MDTPFIIRPFDMASTTCGKEQAFSLIGNCYFGSTMEWEDGDPVLTMECEDRDPILLV
jgi:hypothetical protein